jgi:hypothetical protein
MEEKDLAHVYFEELQRLRETPGFKLFVEQLHREVRRAEVELMTIGKEPNLTSEQLVMMLRDRQGFLRGLKFVEELPEEMLEVFNSGRVPWLEKKSGA